MPGAKIGIKCAAYLNVTGNAASPVWTELKLISDATLAATMGEAKATTRNAAVEESEPILAEVSLTGKILKDPTDAGYAALSASFWNRTSLDVLALDGKTSANGSEGVRFTGKSFTWTEDQSMGTVVFKEFAIKPCANSTCRVATVTNANGTLSYADPG